MSSKSREESEGQVVTRARTAKKLQPPRMYRVLLHNDDYTSMEFVVSILKSIFGKDPEEATEIMFKVHYEGIALAGIYPFEIAETKVAQVIAAAQAHEFPFLATMEPEEENVEGD